MNDEGTSTIWRTVFPAPHDHARLPLYVDGDSSAVTITGRTSLRISPGGRASLGSYFNALPSAYWRTFTGVDEVLLSIRTRGSGTVTAHRSGIATLANIVDAAEVKGEAITVFRIGISELTAAGALWCELRASADDALELESAEWRVSAIGQATATVAMATFNRPSECLAQLTQLADDESVWEVLDRIVVVDQGTDLVQDEAGFPSVQERLGDRLTLIRQANLGGSGGFSRGMSEALQRQESSHVLLLDDDAVSEPEAIVRAVRFAGLTHRPTIVGGGMLHLDNPAVLYAQSEQWSTRTGWVSLRRSGAYDHDFSEQPFRDTRILHSVQLSDFNGWWMCAIPLSLLRQQGLSLPVFLKGDDVEFGLRAKAHGVETVSPPGIATWHLGWAGKAPTRTWEGYFLHRNRLITELLHNPARRPLGVVAHCLLGDLKLLASLQYSALRLRAEAVSDLRAAPEMLTEWLTTKPAEVRRWWEEYPDARRVEGISAPSLAVPPPRSLGRAALVMARLLLRHLLVAVPEARRVRPEGRIGVSDFGYWTFARADSMLVPTPDGGGVTWFLRSRRETRYALWRSIRMYAGLWWRWPVLSRRWRIAAEGLASPGRWAEVFSQ